MIWIISAVPALVPLKWKALHLDELHKPGQDCGTL